MNTTLLKEELYKRGISQGKFAKECDYISTSHMSGILNGLIRPGPKVKVRMEVGLQTLGFKKTEIARLLPSKKKQALI
jgi:hypothetical protein